ncbi:MAG: hypothetical protein JWM14_821 [Chitinophagaceae bacterium]|nr:hypothetical protein [Chitinophagaceae bacterium]
MNKSLLYSRILQFSIVLSFLLPFFFVGCDQKTDESASVYDSTVVATDTLSKDVLDTLHEKNTSSDSSTINTTQTTDTIGTGPTAAVSEENDKSFSKELVREYEWLSPILIPSPEVYTGIALVINLGSEAIFINIFFAFLLILICLSIKFLEKYAIRTQILINMLALAFLYVYIPTFLSGERLWGFWVCFTLILVTIANDIYRLIEQRRKNIAVK